MKPRRWITIAIPAVILVALAGCSSSSGSHPNTPPSPANVAILVVDDFLPKGRPVPASLPTTGNCTFATNEVSTNGAGDGDLGGNSHGAIVYRVLQQRLDRILGAAARTPTPTGPDPIAQDGTLTEWNVPVGSGSYTLSLIAVHLPGYVTDDAETAVGKALAAVKTKVTRFVLNLSFVTLPCDPTPLLSSTNQNDLLTWYTNVLNGPGDASAKLN